MPHDMSEVRTVSGMAGGKVVVLNGGFGGIAAARKLKGADATNWIWARFAHEPSGRITVPTEKTA